MGSRWITLLLLVLVACEGESEPPIEISSPPRPVVPPEPVTAAVEPPPTFELPALPKHYLLVTYPDEAYERLAALHSGGPVRVGEEEFAAAVRDAEQVKVHLQRMLEDRWYRHEYVVRTNVRRNPRFDFVKFDVVSRKPWLIFLEKPERHRSGRLTGEEYADLLTALHEKFREVLGEGIELPSLEGGPDQSPIVLTVFVFRKGRSHQTSEELTREPISPALATYHDRRENCVVGCEEGPNGDPSNYRSHLLYAATLHLLSAYRWATVRALPNAPPTWTDPEGGSRLYWFEDGMGELFSVARDREDGEIEFLGLKLRRLRALKKWRESGARQWSFLETIRMSSVSQFRRECRKRDLGDTFLQLPAFSCQVWTLMHFLYHFEDGKYRPRLLRYIGRHLRGESGVDSFREAWDAGGDCDWAAVNWEWRTHVVKLLKLVD